MKRYNEHEYYLSIAKSVAMRSTCLKRKYGCVIVNKGEIISTGYNGSPRGFINCTDIGKCKREHCERYSGYESCTSVHAEQNALISSSRRDMLGGTAYLYCIDANTTKDDANPLPCSICARMLVNAGIEKVYNLSGEVDFKEIAKATK